MALPGFLYAERPYVPPPPPKPFLRTPMTWTGWDGSVWDLANPDGGIVLERVRGLDAGDSDRFAQASPGVAGSRTTGYQDLERPAFWQLRVWSDVDSKGWQDRYRAIMRTLQRGRVGVWSVTGPDGKTRTLEMEFVSEDVSSLEEYDAPLFGWSQHLLNFTAAEQPFWQGVPVRRTFGSPDVQDFIPPGGAPSFYISPGSSAASATLTNDGDVRAWPEWWLYAGTESAALGVDGKVVEVPFEVPAGKLLVVDARPTRRAALQIDAPPAVDGNGIALTDEEVEAWVDAAVEADTALDRTKELGAVAWAAIPDGGRVPLDLTLVGAGAVRVKITPLFHRALA